VASPLVQASLKAPGFLGLNTEQSAASTRQQFASVLDNAVFDESGKIQARKGYEVLADSGPTTVDRVFFWRKDEGTEKLMAVGDASGTATLYEMTTTSNAYDTFTSRGTMNSTDVLLINVNEQLVILEAGQSPKAWDGTGTLANIAAATGTTANPTGGIGCTAFGRLFVVSSDRKVVHGSELQPDPKTTGIDWDNWFIDTTGNSGATAVDGWVYGKDLITAVSAFDQYLVIFGEESILLFSDVNGTPTLADSITGVGCINQHSVKHTGDDLLFMSATGVRSLRRSLQKELPDLGDVSAFVRSDVIGAIDATHAQAIYSPYDGLYVISGITNAYAFDARESLPGGAMRASVWTLAFNNASVDTATGTVFLAIGDAVAMYSGYTDDGATYRMTIKSQWLDLGRNELKIIKKLSATIYNGMTYTPKFFWAFDWKVQAESLAFASQINAPSGAEWGASSTEWGSDDEWGGYSEVATTKTVNGSGSGLNVRYGLEFTVNGVAVGVHEIRLFAKLGRLAHV
jgi:hypothetical protein